jgi:hypothetical protein
MANSTIPVGRALDAEVASVVFGISYEWIHGDYLLVDPEDPIAYLICPPYSTAIAAAFAVEDRVMQMGCEAVYAYQLVQLVLGDSAWRFFTRGADEDSIFRIVHASPEQRCRAALHAVLTHSSISNKRYNSTIVQSGTVTE